MRLDDRVASYWPEFERRGKEDVRVIDVMTHRAGIPAFLENLEPAAICAPDYLAGKLADAGPFWPGERRLAYHALHRGGP